MSSEHLLTGKVRFSISRANAEISISNFSNIISRSSTVPLPASLAPVGTSIWNTSMIEDVRSCLRPALLKEINILEVFSFFMNNNKDVEGFG